MLHFLIHCPWFPKDCHKKKKKNLSSADVLGLENKFVTLARQTIFPPCMCTLDRNILCRELQFYALGRPYAKLASKWTKTSLPENRPTTTVIGGNPT